MTDQVTDKMFQGKHALPYQEMSPYAIYKEDMAALAWSDEQAKTRAPQPGDAQLRSMTSNQMHRNYDHNLDVQTARKHPGFRLPTSEGATIEFETVGGKDNGYRPRKVTAMYFDGVWHPVPAPEGEKTMFGSDQLVEHYGIRTFIHTTDRFNSRKRQQTFYGEKYV